MVKNRVIKVFESDTFWWVSCARVYTAFKKCLLRSIILYLAFDISEPGHVKQIYALCMLAVSWLWCETAIMRSCMENSFINTPLGSMFDMSKVGVLSPLHVPLLNGLGLS